MPYYVHPKTVTLTVDTAYPYEYAYTAESAQRLRHVHAHQHSAQSGLSLADYKVTFLASDDEIYAWDARERARFGKGEYVHVPWHNVVDVPDACTDHYPHLAIKGEGLIAYTKSVEHGVNDRQTRVRPGRYLEQFYSHIPKVTRDQWIAQCQATDTPLQLATTPEDICAVYEGGPDSCMSGPLDGNKAVYWHWNRRNNPPVMAYGNSDFGVVYTGPIESASGRCVVRLAEKTFTRIYGDVDRLALVLERNGYTLGTLHGARLRAIRDGSGYLSPYVDGLACNESGNPHRDGESREIVAGTLSADRQWITLDNRGNMDVTTTSGITTGEPYDDDEDGDSDPENSCGNCGESCGGEDYCRSCNQDRWDCDDCDNSFFDDGVHRVGTDNQTLCERCAEAQFRICAIDGCENDWYHRDISASHRRMRQNDHLSDICESCAEDHTWCHNCEVYFASDTCDTCDRYATTQEEALPLEAEPTSVSLPLGTLLPRESVDSRHTLDGAIAECVWTPALNTEHCRMRSCDARIIVHTLCLAHPSGFGYCSDCAVRFRQEMRPVPLSTSSSVQESTECPF